MTDQDAKQTKDKCLQDIRGYLEDRRHEKLAGARAFFETDARLLEYVRDCVREDADRANLYELLGIRKVLRMAEAYTFDSNKAKKVLYVYEGQWKGGEHICGGLLFSGLKGRTHYRLTPLQVWELAVPFGFMRADNDRRRKITECVYFIPRKSSKTTLAAFFQVWFFFNEDYNNEGYCVANSQDQSKILYKLVYDLVHQLDKGEKRIRFTQSELNWKSGQAKACKIAALTAGGKTKDGLFAGLVCADEYGSAAYVKEKSDMANLLNVVEGSMGARREPLTVITTTAGRVIGGPFQIKLEGIKRELEKEMSVPLGVAREMETDWQYSVLCCPDQWETDDASLRRPEVWRKVNRHIGVTVQEDYYANEWKKMLLDPEKKKEQITKLFNVFQTSRIRRWIDADKIVKGQGRRSIDEIDVREGWVCMVGMDFSRGDDLCGVGYLCYNRARRKFYADCDMWITSEAMEKHQNALLYRELAAGGWLHVCEGGVIEEQRMTERLAEVVRHVRVLRCGYDPYDARLFVNYLKAWLTSQGVNGEKMVVPVRQTWGTFNSAVQALERLVAMGAVEFSQNPLLPWCFGNCVLEEDRMGNVKPVKAGANAKIDPVICVLEGIIMLEELGAAI
ncbi:MAG: terminase large subunit [Bacteroidales bacterium]|nr:terminase large subunit [Bacteroidales bacterium]